MARVNTALNAVIVFCLAARIVGSQEVGTSLVQFKLELEHGHHFNSELVRDNPMEIRFREKSGGSLNTLREMSEVAVNETTSIPVIAHRGGEYQLEVNWERVPNSTRQLGFWVSFSRNNVRRSDAKESFQALINDPNYVVSYRNAQDDEMNRPYVLYKKNASVEIRIVDDCYSSRMPLQPTYVDFSFLKGVCDAAYKESVGKQIDGQVLSQIFYGLQNEKSETYYPNSWFGTRLPYNQVQVYNTTYKVIKLFEDTTISYRAILLEGPPGSVYILAFAGSLQWQDFVVDGLQLIPGLSTAPYRRALDDTREVLKSEHLRRMGPLRVKSPLMVMGHSLGGGQALYCSGMTGVYGVGFNAAPLRGALMSLRSRGVNNVEKYFTNVVTEIDLVTHDSPGIRIGECYTVESDGRNSLTQHLLGNMKEKQFINYESSARRPYNY